MTLCDLRTTSGIATIVPMHHQPEASAPVRVVDRPVLMVPLFALIAAVGGLFPSFTLGSTLLVFAVGATMVWVAMTATAGRRVAPRRLGRGAWWWLVPALLLGLTELWAFLGVPRDNYPTISLLFDPVLEHYLPRAIAWFGWITGFWVLVRR